MIPTEVDVLVVGAGPVGLAMALELTRHGLEVLQIERKLERDPWSKAAAVTARTLEVFEMMGVAEPILAEGCQVHGASLYTGDHQLGHFNIASEGTRHPYMLGISQRRTEELLEAQLQRRGVTPQRGQILKALSQDDLGIDATVEDLDGQQRRVRARWLIGCDGAHSTTRELLGIPFEGDTFEQLIAHADVTVTWPSPPPPGEALVFIGDGGPVGFLPLFAEGRYRCIVMNPDPWEGEAIPFEHIQAHVTARCPEGVAIHDPQWHTHFRFHGKLASRYRQQRVFLAGDAAHIHSPAGAQGMNTGIQDAFNLAWKLAMVDQGLADEALLDSYEQERRPVGQLIVESTDRATRAMFRAMTLQNPAIKAMRDSLMGMALASGLPEVFAVNALSGLNITYGDSDVIDERRLGATEHRLWHSDDDERPAIGDGLRFSKAPGPGHRVPDLNLGQRSLHQQLHRSAQHLLLLMDGHATTEVGYQNLSRIAMEVEARYGDRLQVQIVVPADHRPEALDWSGPVVLDQDSAVHDILGARSECLYLIRPDGYVGFRSQPADLDVLMDHLEHIFEVAH